MPGDALERRHRRQRFGPEERRRFVLSALERPRTQSELRDALGMSNSGILHLLRRLERYKAAEPSTQVCIWREGR